MSAERAKPTEAEIAAWLLRVAHHSWPNQQLPCGSGPLRDAARRAGLVEVRRLNTTHGPYRTFLTPSGKESLVNVPGSGFTGS